MSILNVRDKVFVDDTITGYEIHTHQPYTHNFANSDEIHITEDGGKYTHPSESCLYVEGKLQAEDGSVPTTTKFVNNGVLFLFNEIRYEANARQVDHVTKVGWTTTMKGYLSKTKNESDGLQNAGWFPYSESTLCDANGKFNALIPLKMILGFPEDYKQVIVLMKQNLVLIRSNTDNDALISTTANAVVKVVITKICWQMPHVTVGLKEDLALTKLIERNEPITVAYRSMETHIKTELPQTTKHVWVVKASSQLEAPRYVILGFQTARAGDINKDPSQFDDCDIANVTVFLNDQRYPYANMNINIGENRFATMYQMYAQFQQSYYEKANEPLFNPTDFKKKSPLTVIDCSRHQPSLSPTGVTLRLEIETNKNIPANTTAYCMILHDRVFTYHPLTQLVNFM